VLGVQAGEERVRVSSPPQQGGKGEVKMVFQITEDDLRRWGTLEPEDLGKWCYLVNGALCGFKSTRAEAEDQRAEVFRD
jgi:hypothetical protein